jgi:oxalate decarboxylase
MAKSAQQTRDDPRPIRGNRGATILGPQNIPLERENPDLLASPYTDNGTIPNLKFSFATARNRLITGGWAREVTSRELPVATELAGVNMRLKPGGIREMHWHKEAEWAFMLAGRARITAVDEQGRTFIDDVGEATSGIFPRSSRIQSRVWRRAASFYWYLTTAPFRRTRPS